MTGSLLWGSSINTSRDANRFLQSSQRNNKSTGQKLKSVSINQLAMEITSASSRSVVSVAVVLLVSLIALSVPDSSFAASFAARSQSQSFRTDDYDTQAESQPRNQIQTLNHKGGNNYVEFKTEKPILMYDSSFDLPSSYVNFDGDVYYSESAPIWETEDWQ